MNFYVYEYEKRYVRIHAGRCKHCNEGQGKHVTGELYGRWHGPYPTLEKARVFSKTLKIKNIRACRFCLE